MSDGESLRRKLNLITVWCGWTSTLGLSCWIVMFDIPQTTRWPTFAVIVLIGISITSSLIRSRYKLQDVIVESFRAGVRAGRSEHKHEPPEED